MDELAVPLAVVLCLIGLAAILWEVGAIIAFWTTVALVIGFPFWLYWSMRR